MPVGDEHYNMISALQKSIRGSDRNAALYWLVRMLEGGEDPMFIARRLIDAASGDVGKVKDAAEQISLISILLLFHCTYLSYFYGQLKKDATYFRKENCQQKAK